MTTWVEPDWESFPAELKYLQDGLKRYLQEHIPPGHFLRAVLRNDLFCAVNCADSTSSAHLQELAFWIYSELPAICWGSPEAVKLWLNGGVK